MPRLTWLSRIGAVLVLIVSCTTASATAQETSGSTESHYASLLRSINPHLQQHQSLAFARSVLASAERSNLDPRLIMALVTVESAWRPNAVSRVGARGLGQLMPKTAATLHVNPWDPAQNLRGAASYLRSLIDHFSDRGANTMRYAIGAYNAGPHAVEKYNGIPPYAETRNYVKRVLHVWHTLNARVGNAFADTPSTTASPDAMWLEHASESALSADAAPETAPAEISVPSLPVANPLDTPVSRP